MSLDNMEPIINWKEIKTVLFDMDGTLLDLYFDYYFWQEYLPEQWAKKNNMSTQEAKVKLLDWYEKESGTLSWYCLDFWTQKLNFDVFALKADVRHLIKYRPHAESFLKRLHQIIYYSEFSEVNSAERIFSGRFLFLFKKLTYSLIPPS